MIATALPLDEIIEHCTETVESLDFPEALEWKSREAGRAIIGSFPVYSPVEVFHAAGALPVGITGGGNRLEISHADARFQSFVCSIVKSTLELSLVGKFDEFDGFVFHSICDPARNLASVFQRNAPDKAVEYIHFPQRLHSTEAVTYLAAEYQRLAEWATSLGGHPVNNERLRRSIVLYDTIRARIRDLYEYRRTHPQDLPTRDLYALVRYGHVAPPEKHLRVLDEAFDQIRKRENKPKDRARVLLVGSFCEQPPIDLIAAIESAGCYIIDDDFVLGRRFFNSNIPDTGRPFCDLADAYVNHSVDSSVKHDLTHNKYEALVRRAQAYHADAVVVLTAKFCEPALFDYALYRKAMQEAHMPHVFLEFEEKMWLFDKIKTEIETFVESLLFT